MDLRAGDHVGRYVVLDVLGEGGMSVVYRARDTTLERDIALKVLRRHDEAGGPEDSGGVSTKELASRMFKEARAAAALAHTNAVAVYEFGEEDGRVFIAMELVKGRSLRELMQEPAVPIGEKIRWLAEVAEVLAVAHDNGIVHRDVKPENIMVRRDGLVKVLDFGVAKRVRYTANKADPEQSAETAAGTLLGTPHYMSPEQLRGNPVDGRSDQFAWGVVAYEILSGRLPWNDATDGMSLVLAIVEEVPPRLTPALVRDLPAEVGLVIEKALSKERDHRFPTMAHVALELAPHAGPAPTQGTSLPNLPNVTTNPTARLQLASAKKAVWLPGLAAAVAGALLVIGTSLAFVPRLRPWAAKPKDVGVVVAPKVPWFETAAANAQTAVPNARALYRQGLLAFRAGAFESARKAFLEAVQLDPTLVAGKLRLGALESMMIGDGNGEARRYLRATHQERDRLSPEDQSLLASLEPWIQEEPPNLEESERRLVASLASGHGTCEHRFFLGLVRSNRGDYVESVKALDAALEEDPEFAQVFAVKAQAEAYGGDTAKAMRTAARCTEVSPAATDCLFAKIVVEEVAGSCDAMEKDARTWIEHDPDDKFGYTMLLRALVAEGRPRPILDALLARPGAAIDEYAQHQLDAVFGNLDAVTTYGRAKLAGGYTKGDREVRQAITVNLVEALREHGRRDEAIAVARKGLAQEDAWGFPSHADDSAILLDTVPRTVSLLASLGGMSPAELERQRNAWIERWRKRTPTALLGFVWVAAYGDMALDQASAERALKELPSFGEIPSFMPVGNGDLRVGTVLARAGHFDEALPYLRRGLASCSYFSDPVRFMEGFLLLADTYAARGELDLACETIARARARWTDPHLRSVTMDALRQRGRDLRCEP